MCRYCSQTWYERRKAIESITINPAKTLGIEDRVGSIEVGKDADLVIWDNSPLEIQSNVLYTIINGKVVYEKNNLTIIKKLTNIRV